MMFSFWQKKHMLSSFRFKPADRGPAVFFYPCCLPHCVCGTMHIHDYLHWHLLPALWMESKPAFWSLFCASVQGHSSVEGQRWDDRPFLYFKHACIFHSERLFSFFSPYLATYRRGCWDMLNRGRNFLSLSLSIFLHFFWLELWDPEGVMFLWW